jgi:hypothetical protein
LSKVSEALAGHSSLRETKDHITPDVGSTKNAAGKIGMPVTNEKNEMQKGKKRP